jgi:release factor glutamine methyltransferase
MILMTSAKLIDLHLGVHIKAAYHQLSEDISPLYDSREAKNIADWIMEELTGWDHSKRLIHQDKLLDESQIEKLNTYTEELLGGKPIQYILSKAWFMGSSFYVDERVLIPRPETEELVDLIKHKYQDLKNVDQRQIRVVDIGTGSGCIAISLKKIFPDWEIWAIDKSLGALDVTNKNAAAHRTELISKQLDILNNFKNISLPTFDIIVSNPPYIPESDKIHMSNHVLLHEPHQALFVSNNDPLQFYKAIIDFSTHHMQRGGMIFFESHEEYASDVAELIEKNDFEEVLIKKDFQGKDRMISARKIGSSL